MKHPQTKKIFLETVQIDSPSFYEKAMADYIIAFAEQNGWKCKISRQEVSVGALSKELQAQYDKSFYGKITEQLQLTLEANCEGKEPIFLCAHMDTVEPGRGIKPYEKNGYIYSDGNTILGADDKTGVAAILAAVDEIVKNRLPHGRLVLLFNACEELDQLGANLIDINSFGVHYGYVFDTMRRIGRMVKRSQHGKTIKVTLKADYLPNHTYSCTVPNSLTAAVDLAAKLDKRLNDASDMTFGQITELENFYKPGYMAPEKTVFKYVARSFDTVKAELLTAEAERIINEFSMPNIKIDCRSFPVKTIGYDMEKIPRGIFLMEKAAAILKDMGIEPEYITDGLGNHDASSFIIQNVPTLVLSSGMYEIHTASEYTTEKDLDELTELIKRLVEAA